jgi:oligopeptidase B
VISGTKVTQFVLYLSCDESDGDMKPLSPHNEGEDYFATHRGDHFYFTRRSKEIFNSELLVAPVDNLSSLKVLLPHRPRLAILIFLNRLNFIVLQLSIVDMREV